MSEFDNAILYFRNIFSNNITKPSFNKVGATFIGIDTNITGNHIDHIDYITSLIIDWSIENC